MTKSKFLPYARQNISAEDLEAVKQALMQPIITRGPTAEAFESAIAAYCEAKYAVAFNSATAALMAAYDAAETGPHDTILTTPNTFVSTIGSGIQKGATPVFIDIDRSTGNIDLEQLIHNLQRRSSKGKTVIAPVHFSGIAVDIQKIDGAISDPETVIIEDAAHALGSCYADGTKIGSCQWSQMTVFSFHPAKTITTGEGGVVTTNDEKLCHRLRLFRDNGIEKDPQHLRNHPYPGYYEAGFLSGNYNFTEMQAALGLSQLKRVDQFIAKRQRLMDLYRQKLPMIEHVRLFTPPEDLTTAYHLCVVQIDFGAYKKTKAAVMEKLKALDIGTQVHYIPVYRHPFFADRAGDISEYYPEMESYYAQALSLPLYFDLTEEDVDRVTSTLKNVLHS